MSFLPTPSGKSAGGLDSPFLSAELSSRHVLVESRTRSAAAGSEPRLPSPAEKPPSGASSIHEIKHGGYRSMARRDPGGIRLLTRRGNDWADRLSTGRGISSLWGASIFPTWRGWRSAVCVISASVFRRSTAAFDRRVRGRGLDQSIRADVLGNEIGVLTEPIARAFDLDDDGVVEQPIEQRGGDDGIAEDLAPFGEAAVRGEDHGALLVAGVDELEEQIAAAGNDRQVADLVDDEQREAAEEADLLAQGALALGLGERADEIG